MANPPFFDVRMRGFRDRVDVADAMRLVDERLAPLAPENVAVSEASQRVLAESVVSGVSVPPFDRAAMDGYALRAEETFAAGTYNPMALRVVGTALPGRPFGGSVALGQAVRVMTGAPLPAGADAVLPAESAEEVDDLLQVREPVSPGRHIGRRGEDVPSGQTVLPAGRVLRPQDLGLLASIGVATVRVVRRPRVTIVVTGEELLPLGAKPEGFRIVDSNSVMLMALVHRDGGIVQAVEMPGDQREALRSAISNNPGDVLLVTGGTSVGQEDHAPKLVAELGDLPVHGVALRPAAPAGIGFVRAKPVFLLPGNPVSCLCAYDLFAGRALRRLGGRPSAMPYRVRRLPLKSKIVSAVGRVDYVRVCVVEDRVEPIAVSGAALLSTTTMADGFVLVDRDREGHGPGDEVDVFLYDH